MRGSKIPYDAASKDRYYSRYKIASHIRSYLAKEPISSTYPWAPLWHTTASVNADLFVHRASQTENKGSQQNTARVHLLRT
jgi:hypothetical protein